MAWTAMSSHGPSHCHTPPCCLLATPWWETHRHSIKYETPQVRSFLTLLPPHWPSRVLKPLFYMVGDALSISLFPVPNEKQWDFYFMSEAQCTEFMYWGWAGGGASARPAHSPRLGPLRRCLLAGLGPVPGCKLAVRHPSRILGPLAPYCPPAAEAGEALATT